MVKKKKILFVTDIGSPWGGSEELWSKAAIILAKKDYEVYASVSWFNSIHEKIQNLIDLGIVVSFRKSRIRNYIEKAKRLSNNVIISKIETNLNKQINRIKPDLIVFSQSHIFGGWEMYKFLKNINIPYCTISQLNSEFSWANDNNYISIRNFYDNSVKNFFVSKANLKLLEIQLAKEILNSEVIYNPFNFKTVEFIDWNHSDTLNFAYVGRLDIIHKGIDIMLQAFSGKQWRKRDFHLNIYGKGDVKLTKELSKFLKIKNISFRGHVNNIKDIWKQNHILVLSSRYEGMPLVLIEAMYCRRTAVVTDVAGHSELISDGENGFLAKAANYKIFEEKLEDVWSKKSELKFLGEKAFDTVSKKIITLPEIKLSDFIIEFLHKR